MTTHVRHCFCFLRPGWSSQLVLLNCMSTFYSFWCCVCTLLSTACDCVIKLVQHCTVFIMIWSMQAELGRWDADQSVPTVPSWLHCRTNTDAVLRLQYKLWTMNTNNICYRPSLTLKGGERWSSLGLSIAVHFLPQSEHAWTHLLAYMHDIL